MHRHTNRVLTIILKKLVTFLVVLIISSNCFSSHFEAHIGIGIQEKSNPNNFYVGRKSVNDVDTYYYCANPMMFFNEVAATETEIFITKTVQELEFVVYYVHLLEVMAINTAIVVYSHEGLEDCSTYQPFTCQACSSYIGCNFCCTLKF